MSIALEQIRESLLYKWGLIIIAVILQFWAWSKCKDLPEDCVLPDYNEHVVSNFPNVSTYISRANFESLNDSIPSLKCNAVKNENRPGSHWTAIGNWKTFAETLLKSVLIPVHKTLPSSVLLWP